MDGCLYVISRYKLVAAIDIETDPWTACSNDRTAINAVVIPRN